MAKIKWYLIGLTFAFVPIPFVLNTYLPYSHLNYKNHNDLRGVYQSFLEDKNFVDNQKDSTSNDPFGLGLYLKELKQLLDHKDRTYNDYYFDKASKLITSLENAQWLINFEQNSKDNQLIIEVSGQDVIKFDRATRDVLSKFLDPQFYDRLDKYRKDYSVVATDEEKNQMELMYLNYKNARGWQKVKNRQAIINYFDTDVRAEIESAISVWQSDAQKAFNEFPKDQTLTRWQKWNILYKTNGNKLIVINEIKQQLLPQLVKLVDKDKDKIPYIATIEKKLQQSNLLNLEQINDIKNDVLSKITRATLINNLTKNHTIGLDPLIYSPVNPDTLSKLTKVIKDGDVLLYNLYTWKIFSSENKVYNEDNFEIPSTRFLDTLSSTVKNKWRDDLSKYFPILTWQLTNFKEVKKDNNWEQNYTIDSKYTNKEDTSNYVDIIQDDKQLFLQINIVLKDTELNLSVGNKDKPFKLLIPIAYNYRANERFWKSHNKYDPDLQNQQWTIDGIIYHID